VTASSRPYLLEDRRPPGIGQVPDIAHDLPDRRGSGRGLATCLGRE